MHFYLLYISYQQYIYIPDRLYHVQAFLVNICSHYVFKKLYAIFNFMSATMALTALGFRYRTDMFCTGFFYAFSTNTDSPCSWLPDTAAPCIERSSAIVGLYFVHDQRYCPPGRSLFPVYPHSEHIFIIAAFGYTLTR